MKRKEITRENVFGKIPNDHRREFLKVLSSRGNRNSLEEGIEQGKRDARVSRRRAIFPRVSARFLRVTQQREINKREGTFQESADGIRPSFIARITNEFRRMISGFIGFTTDAESVPRFLFPVCLSACTLQARVLPFHADDPESTSLPTGSLSTIARNDRATCAHAAGVSDSLVRRSSNATNAMENPSHRCDREKLR